MTRRSALCCQDEYSILASVLIMGLGIQPRSAASSRIATPVGKPTCRNTRIHNGIGSFISSSSIAIAFSPLSLPWPNDSIERIATEQDCGGTGDVFKFAIPCGPNDFHGIPRGERKRRGGAEGHRL